MGVFLGLSAMKRLQACVKGSFVLIIVLIITFSLLLFAVIDLCVAPRRAVL